MHFALTDRRPNGKKPAQRSLMGALACLLLVAAGKPAPLAADDDFPNELVRFLPYQNNPVFEAAGEGRWDRRIRERGWILKEGDLWRMWYTGYDGTSDGKRMLGLATSPDGLRWTRSKDNPIYDANWVEDMQVVRHGERYYMFAEGLNDRAQLLESNDGLRWERVGQLDIRLKNGDAIPPGPYGTPTALFEDERWFLFYERSDRGVWLATSKDMRVWRNVQDEPVLRPGPDEYDRDMIAMNQVIKYQGHFYGYFHGAAKSNDGSPTLWSTGVAMSDDLIHWQKYSHNPLFPISENKSSGIVVENGQRFRLYTMHNRVEAHLPVVKQQNAQRDR